MKDHRNTSHSRGRTSPPTSQKETILQVGARLSDHPSEFNEPKSTTLGTVDPTNLAPKLHNHDVSEHSIDSSHNTQAL